MSPDRTPRMVSLRLSEDCSRVSLLMSNFDVARKSPDISDAQTRINMR